MNQNFPNPFTSRGSSWLAIKLGLVLCSSTPWRFSGRLKEFGEENLVDRLVFLAIMGTEKTEKLKSMLNVTGSC